MKPYTVGLTGGIGSGKSAVAALFAELGIAVVDTDEIAHELTRAGGAAIEPIRTAFGPGLIGADGALDRARMRKLVFGEPTQKRKLEAILHPLIRTESARRIESSDSAYVILVVPLLTEGGADRARYQRVLVVDCSEAQQIERVMRRSALSEKEVRDILASQATREERLAMADDVIDNRGDPEALERQVSSLNERYLTLARDSKRAS